MVKNGYMPEGAIISTYENKEHLSSRIAMEKAMDQGIILEAVALMCDSSLCLHFDLHGYKGIMKKEECLYCGENEDIKDIAILTRVGKPVCFKIIGTGYDPESEEDVFYLSRRVVQEECIQNYIKKLHPGDIIPAKVTHLENFGAFVDIGCGISSLLSVDCISVSRISHPKDRLVCGINIYAVVKSIDNDTGRVFLSLKELLGTWEENAAHFSQGQTVTGIVRSIESYGIFIELSPNLAGLAEISNYDMDDIVEYKDMINKRVSVYIKSIIPERMKIKLVIIDCCRTELHEKQKKERIKYYVNLETTHHIDRWTYSPACAIKSIESSFES